MVRWHHRLNGHEFEQTLGEREGQGSLVCCSPWGHKESDVTEKLNNSYGSPESVMSIYYIPHHPLCHLDQGWVKFFLLSARV